MEKSWKDAITRVLNESEGPLHYTEISDLILSQGYYETDGATPAATVNAQLAASIKHEGTKSPFIRVSKAVFTLREKSSALSSPIPEKKNQNSDAMSSNYGDSEDEAVLHSFGMYWQRDLVVWKTTPKLFGKQQATSKPVDFSGQLGIYVLYDHHTVVYVGRSIDRPLGKRLSEHTVDRLGSRWNRFSWFGLKDVAEDGTLKDSKLKMTISGIVATLEALLIETLEPPQNRKRGDDLTAIEYIQDIDPELKEKEIQNTLRAIEIKMRGGT